MAQTSSKTGRAGGFTLAGVTIPFTKWSATNTKELADSTDSGDYDAGSGQIFKSQKPGVISQEVTVEFNYDSATTSSAIMAKIKNDSLLTAVLKYDASTTYCTASYDLSEVEMNLEVPGATMITGSAKLMSNGVITYS